jgi:GGDEF domain-containing protein
MTATEEMVEELCLPGRAAAESAISRLMRQGRPAFVLTVLETGVPEINEQYGYSAGDRVLAALARRLTNAAGPSRDLFRWSATSFLVVSRSLEGIGEASSVTGAATSVFSVCPHDQPHRLFDRIDDYIASRLACCDAA